MLIEIRQLTPHTRLGLWRMDEPQDGSPRQRERHAEQLLLTAMMGDEGSYTINHEPSGKPFLSSHLSTTPLPHLSISHTRGYVAILLSDDCQVGVDIEYRSDRVERIAQRFIHPDEKADTTDEKLLLWSAKEAVYKLYSEDRLAFFDMRVLSIGDDVVQMQNMKRNEVVAVSYEFTPDYVLTYVFHPTPCFHAPI